MEYDDDIDLGMMEDDFKKIYSILPEINKKGFFIDTSLIFIPKFWFLRLDYGIDIWPYSKSDKNTFLTFGSGPLKSPIARVLRFIYNLFMHQKTNTNLVTSSSKFELIIAFLIKNFEFYNLTFNVPFDTEGYLKYKYGESWKIPRRKWDWVREDKAVRH